MKTSTILYLLGAVVMLFVVLALFCLPKGYSQDPPFSQYPPKFLGTCTSCEYSPAPVLGDTHAHGSFLNLAYLNEQGLFKVLNLSPTDNDDLLCFIGPNGQSARELPKQGDRLYLATIKFEGSFIHNRNDGRINIISTTLESAQSAFSHALKGELGFPASVQDP